MTNSRRCNSPATADRRPCANPVGPNGICAAGHRTTPAVTASPARNTAAAAADPFATTDPATTDPVTTDPADNPAHPVAQKIAYAIDRLDHIVEDGWTIGTAADIDAAAQWAIPRINDAIARLDGHLAGPTLSTIREYDRMDTAASHISAAHGQLRRVLQAGSTRRLRTGLSAIRDRLLAARIEVLSHAVAQRTTDDEGNGFEAPWTDEDDKHAELSSHLGRPALDHELGYFHDRTFDAIDAHRTDRQRHAPIAAAHPDLTDTQVRIHAVLARNPGVFRSVHDPDTDQMIPKTTQEVIAIWRNHDYELRNPDGTIRPHTDGDIAAAWAKEPLA